MWRCAIVLGALVCGWQTAVSAQETPDATVPAQATESESTQADLDAAHRTAVAKGLEWIARQQCISCHLDPHGKDVALAATWLGKQECVRCHFTVPGQQGNGNANTTQTLLSALASVGSGNTTPAACTRNADRRNAVTYLGLGVAAVPELLRRHVKLPAEMGLLVESVEPESPAQAAGVEQYDILEKINEQLLVNQQQFSALIRSYSPGTEITLALIRANQPRTLSATLTQRDAAASENAGVAVGDVDNDGRVDVLLANGSIPPLPDGAARPIALPGVGTLSAAQDLIAGAPGPDGQPSRPQVTFLGVQTSSPPPALAGQLQLPAGLFLLVDGVDAGSPAEAAGIRAADVLQQLDNQVLVNSEQLGVLIRGHKAADMVTLTLIREGRQTRVLTALAQRDAPQTGASIREALQDYSAAYHLYGADSWHHAQNPYALVDLSGAVYNFAHRPAGASGDEEFVRRVYLDLVGAPPTAEETKKFLDDARADKRRALVDELLSRPDVFAKFKGVSSLEWSDAEHSLHLTSQQGGGRRLIAKDAAGTVVFDGAVETDDQRAQLPTPIAAKLALMLQGIDRRQTGPDVQALLDRVISITAHDAGLSQLVEMLRKETGANIVLNAKALKAAGADLEAPLTFELRDVKLSTALKTIAALVDGAGKAVGYTVDDGVIVITTP